MELIDTLFEGSPHFLERWRCPFCNGIGNRYIVGSDIGQSKGKIGYIILTFLFAIVAILVFNSSVCMF